MYTIHLEEIDSTNLYAKTNLDNLSDRTIIYAERQTKGRGRLQRPWIDLGKGNLFLSFVLKPSTSFMEIFSNMTQYLSVVLCQILEEYGVTPQIKWPNDVLINNKKIAGILAETVIQGNNFKGLVLGIGVNLNADLKLLENIDKAATALNLEVEKNIDINDFRNKLIRKFFENYDRFLTEGFGYIKKYYINHTNFSDTEICVQLFNEKKTGVAESITDKGELVLRENNNQLILTIGDIL